MGNKRRILLTVLGLIISFVGGVSAGMILSPINVWLALGVAIPIMLGGATLFFWGLAGEYPWKI
ncbi:MAG: hypothetical protein AAB577_02325 [Patescibacteria group bacterium]